MELKTGNRSIISFGISPDDKNSKINIAHVYQTGIGLPDRDFFSECPGDPGERYGKVYSLLACEIA